MEFLKAIKSGDYTNCFAGINSLENEQNAAFQEMVSSVERTFENLLKDDFIEPEKRSEFLVPDLPKYRRDVMVKRISSSTKKNSKLSKQSSVIEIAPPSVQQTIQKIESAISSQIDNCFRRSSRIALKTKPEMPVTLPSKARGFNESTSSFVTCVTDSISKARQINETFVKSDNIFADNSTIEASTLNELNNRKMEIDKEFAESTIFSSLVSKSKYEDLQKIGDIVKENDRVAVEHFLQIDEPQNVEQQSRKTFVPPSPCVRLTKIRCMNVECAPRRSLDSSICSEVKEPLCSSTPSNETLESRIIKKCTYAESPMITSNKFFDVQKPKMKVATVFTEESLSSSKGRCTRNRTKIFQEQNNVKLIEAQKKKKDIIETSVEETKRKREERYRKAAAVREAAEKVKMELAQKQEKKKELKLKLAQKQKNENLRIDVLKKKQVASIKLAVAEKRKREEAAKCASFKKDQESEYNTYAIDHVLDGDSSDEEDHPKHKIPSWAKRENRKHQLGVQAYLDREKVVRPWFWNEEFKYPKLETLFSEKVKTRPRTSSAFWNSKICFDEAFPLH